ncbi:AlbA family DNA-binding domain-containing protein [Acidipropionibacterium timonense]|uniref:AlbA family DNA-binding domain-containing protein n=1 Tax=Acidipropionibacterium timonense TaxID=2161818 RepID=UPI00102FE549|nr:ATP-binding protein [Acidipropionibacterium timonense]
MSTTPLNHYLGPTVGLIPLSTWEELSAAAEGGSFEETQWVELKQMLKPGKPGNAELAKDLASLSVHGGVLVIGVTDADHEVVGCDIDGYVTRISQVAATRVHPPLSPVIYPAIPNPNDESKAVLVVEVPASPLAPHMANDTYWGRSSDGTRPLSDADVRLLMRVRATTNASFKQRLLAMVEDDPVNKRVIEAPTGNGHIYLCAEPCAPVVGRADDFDFARVVMNEVGGWDAQTVGALRERSRDPLGQALAYPSAADAVVERRYEDSVAHLLLRDDDSSVEFVSGGGTYYRLRGPRGEADMEVLGTGIIISAVREFLELVRVLSLQHWGYQGQWRIGLHVTGLEGKHVSFNDIMRRDVTFPRDTLTTQITTAPAAWAEGAVDPVARQLLAGFLRAIGCEAWDLDTVASR